MYDWLLHLFSVNLNEIPRNIPKSAGNELKNGVLIAYSSKRAENLKLNLGQSATRNSRLTNVSGSGSVRSSAS
jgi:hypothetical protein